MKKALVLLFSILLFSCSNNVYIDDTIDSPIWRVGNVYFKTANDAISYVMSTTGSSSRALKKTEDENRTIVLTRDVLSEESISELGSGYEKYVACDYLRGSITIPEGFTGSLTIDFGGHRYDFANTNEAFFVIEGGDNVYIYNGTSVIYDEASHVPYAIAVNSGTVTMDSHLIDDRRAEKDENETNRLLYVGEKGHLSVDNVKIDGDGKSLSGGIAVVTDGTSGAQLDINASDITITNIYTKYKNEDGTVSDEIPDVTISDSAKSAINIYSGNVDIESINKKTDYYDSDTTSIFDKAYINICGQVENTTIKSTHDVYDVVKKAIEKAKENGTGDATLILIHNLTHYERVEATCTENGNIEYWKCTTCGSLFLDESATTETSEDQVLIEALRHKFPLIKEEESESTCASHGYKAHWYCERCNQPFLDKDGTQETTTEDVTKPLVDHEWDEGWQTDEGYHWHVCEYGCGTTTEKEVHKEVLTYNKNYHWYECSVCGRHLSGSKAHTFSDEGTYCTECGYVKEETDSDSGFDVTPQYKDPTGKIESSYDSTLDKWTFTLKPTNPDSIPTGWQWYVDGTAVDGANASTFEFIPLKKESYVIFCMFWNDNGAGSSEMNI